MVADGLCVYVHGTCMAALVCIHIWVLFKCVCVHVCFVSEDVCLVRVIGMASTSMCRFSYTCLGASITIALME